MSRLGRRIATGLRWLLLVLILGIVIFPVYWMVVSSISGASQFSWPPKLLPTSLALDSYRRILTQEPLIRWALNTVVVSLGTALISVLVSITAGLSLSRYRNRLSSSAGAIVLITQMLPATLLVIPMYIIFSRLGLVDSLAGLTVADTAFSIPLAIWMLKGFFDGIPRDLEEAAMVDGCSELAAFRHVTIPLAIPGVVAVGIFAFMVAWGEFFFARTLINSEGNWVLSVGIDSLQGVFVLHWADVLAGGTLFAVPPILLFLGLQRYFVVGLTGGAVKG